MSPAVKCVMVQNESLPVYFIVHRKQNVLEMYIKNTYHLNDTDSPV